MSGEPEGGDVEGQQAGRGKRAVTIEDYHAQKVGEAVLEALSDADPQFWFDVGVAVATDQRVKNAIHDARERRHYENLQVWQDDLGEILELVGLGDHARAASPHSVVQYELIPHLREIMARLEAPDV